MDHSFWEANWSSVTQETPNFMESDGLLLFLKNRVACPYPNLNGTGAEPHVLSH